MTAAAQHYARSAKIGEYERFIGDRLAPDLQAAEEAKGAVQRAIDTCTPHPFYTLESPSTRSPKPCNPTYPKP